MTFFSAPFESSQTSAIYSLAFSRRGENLTASFGVARALTPTGSAFLSRSDSLNASFTYDQSERWSYGGSANWAAIHDPLIAGGSANRRYYYATLSATWHWTEQWNVILKAVKVAQISAGPSNAPGSNNLSVEISRQFYRTNQ